MTSINPYSGLGVSTVGATATTNTQTLGQAEFLKLMTAQMTHQDPNKPMENGEFLSQMAQFGTVSGIQDLQKSFKDFAASIGSNQTLQAASLIGHTVSSLSDRGVLEAGGQIKGTVNLPASSSNVKLKILDPVTGAVIGTKSLGGHAAGPVPFVWDGTNDKGNLAAPGVYKVQLETTGTDGTNTVLQPEIQSRVESVSMNGSGGLQVKLIGLGTINYSQITQIL
jgi:flagellar basal-body rod modification protein FlgD